MDPLTIGALVLAGFALTRRQPDDSVKPDKSVSIKVETVVPAAVGSVDDGKAPEVVAQVTEGKASPQRFGTVVGNVTAAVQAPYAPRPRPVAQAVTSIFGSRARTTPAPAPSGSAPAPGVGAALVSVLTPP